MGRRRENMLTSLLHPPLLPPISQTQLKARQKGTPTTAPLGVSLLGRDHRAGQRNVESGPCTPVKGKTETQWYEPYNRIILYFLSDQTIPGTLCSSWASLLYMVIDRQTQAVSCKSLWIQELGLVEFQNTWFEKTYRIGYIIGKTHWKIKLWDQCSKIIKPVRTVTSLWLNQACCHSKPCS